MVPTTNRQLEMTPSHEQFGVIDDAQSTVGDLTFSALTLSSNRHTLGS